MITKNEAKAIHKAISKIGDAFDIDLWRAISKVQDEGCKNMLQVLFRHMRDFDGKDFANYVATHIED